MWKVFISAALAALVLGGCATMGGNDTVAGGGNDAVRAGGNDAVGGRDAVEGLSRARSDAPANPSSLPLGKPLPPAPEVSGRNAEVFARATELFLDGRLVEAEALLLEVTADQPELAGPWVNLAQVYLAQGGRDDEALTALEQAVLANPGNCAARTELGVLLRQRGEFQAAEDHYLACLEYQPDYQAAYLNLGILYDLYLGRLDDALAAYRQYQNLATEPDNQVNGWVVDLERRLGS